MSASLLSGSDILAKLNDVVLLVLRGALVVAGCLALLTALFWLSSRAWSFLHHRFMLWTASRSHPSRSAETLLAALSVEVAGMRDAEAIARARGDSLLKIAQDEGILCAVPGCEKKAVLYISRTRPSTPSRFCREHTGCDLAHVARRESANAGGGPRA